MGAGVLFAAAAVTDQLDGWLARRWRVESQFGKIADPLADRLMIGVAVVLMWPRGACRRRGADRPRPRRAAPGRVQSPRAARLRLRVNTLGKIATWMLYASLALVLVTEEGTAWPIWLFWAGVVLAVAASVSTRSRRGGRWRTMKAVVMAGGEGTRLRPLTSNQPKPMVPIVGKPCMEHILELLRTPASRRSSSRSPSCRRRSAATSATARPSACRWTTPWRSSRWERPARSARERKLDDTFLVISGDALCDVDLASLVAAHRDRDATVTIGLKSVENPSNSGSS